MAALGDMHEYIHKYIHTYIHIYILYIQRYIHNTYIHTVLYMQLRSTYYVLYGTPLEPSTSSNRTAHTSN